MKKVESCVKEMEIVMVVAQIGKTLLKHLNSSTCVTMHKFHLFLVIDDL